MVAVWGRGWLRAVLSYSRLVWLGKISYGLYMYHEIALLCRDGLDGKFAVVREQGRAALDRGSRFDDRNGGRVLLWLRTPVLAAQTGVDQGPVAARLTCVHARRVAVRMDAHGVDLGGSAVRGFRWSSNQSAMIDMSLNRSGQPCCAPFLTTSLVSTPADLSLSRMSSAC